MDFRWRRENVIPNGKRFRRDSRISSSWKRKRFADPAGTRKKMGDGEEEVEEVEEVEEEAEEELRRIYKMRDEKRRGQQ